MMCRMVAALCSVCVGWVVGGGLNLQSGGSEINRQLGFNPQGHNQLMNERTAKFPVVFVARKT